MVAVSVPSYIQVTPAFANVLHRGFFPCTPVPRLHAAVLILACCLRMARSLLEPNTRAEVLELSVLSASRPALHAPDHLPLDPTTSLLLQLT